MARRTRTTRDAQKRLDAYEAVPRNTAPRAAGVATSRPTSMPLYDPHAGWTVVQSPGMVGQGGEPVAVKRRREAADTIPLVTEAAEERLRRLIGEGLQAAGFQAPRLTLDVRAYAGLRASLEQDAAGPFRRGERLTMRLSDGYIEAPAQALRGLGAALGLRMFPKRRKAPELAALLAEYYDAWQRSKDARDLQSRLRRARAKKQGRGPKGDVYDLAVLTGRITDTFLGGRLKPVKVTWSPRESYTVLGHHDGDLDTIVVSRALDDPEVPEAVVAYVLYHELLHHTMGIQEGPDHTRRLHPPAFRRREQRFPHWAIADAYLETMCARRRPIQRARAKAEWRPLWDVPWDRYAASPRPPRRA